MQSVQLPAGVRDCHDNLTFFCRNILKKASIFKLFKMNLNLGLSKTRLINKNCNFVWVKCLISVFLRIIYESSNNPINCRRAHVHASIVKWSGETWGLGIQFLRNRIKQE